MTEITDMTVSELIGSLAVTQSELGESIETVKFLRSIGVNIDKDKFQSHFEMLEQRRKNIIAELAAMFIPQNGFGGESMEDEDAEF